MYEHIFPVDENISLFDQRALVVNNKFKMCAEKEVGGLTRPYS